MSGRQGGGRRKNVTGGDTGGGRRGSGLGGGPVGRGSGYSGRPTGSSGNGGYQGSSGGNVTRSFGGKLIIILILAAVLIFGGGGKILSGLFGGGTTSSTGGLTLAGDPFSMLGSLMGGTDGSAASSVSGGWKVAANTGKLDTSVAQGARAKRTEILGSGRDVVTIMVYMCGTDLESKNGMATNDLAEMSKASLGKNVNLIVMTGGAKSWKNNIISSSVNQIYKIENGKLRRLEENFGKDSMVTSSTLTSFIRYCTANYPANRNELILWDHGGGSVTGFGYDEKKPTSGAMSLKDISEALRNAGAEFDFIGFDACLMATLETGLMLDDYADYMIASEETEPGLGWYYADWLTKLSQNTSMPTVEIGKNIVDDFVSHCNMYCSGQKTTLSVIDLAELSATVPDKLKDFASSTTELINNNDYKVISDARSQTREFSPSSKIDQIDLVHLAYNIGTAESKALADSLLGAVKYNKTSSSITNAYGLSIYFPYKKSSRVDSAVATYEAIGIDDSYSRCISQFASLEVAGQASTTGNSSPLESLLGGLSGSSSSSSGVMDIVGSLLGGNGSSLLGSLTGGSSNFFGRDIDVSQMSEYVAENQFDASKLVWTEEDDGYVMSLSDEQWNLVHDLQLNVFFDDGEGYIDLGLDSVFDFTTDGDLVGSYDGTWIAIDGQKVAFYCIDSYYDGDDYIITGRVPVLLNDTRADLVIIIQSTGSNTETYTIAGALYNYVEGETDAVAKVSELSEGDTIDLVCDYYDYNGGYLDSYMFGSRITYSSSTQVSYVNIDPSAANPVYLFTDIYNNEYWTPVIPD